MLDSTRSFAIRGAAAICLMSGLQAQNPPVTDSKAVPVAAVPDRKVIVIPDGTAIEMRFAQPVRGKMLDPVDVGTESKAGDTVRLVSVSELRINGLVVIAEGAMAQATIVKIKKPMTTLVATGLGLQLDWIESITATHIPLRIFPGGDPAPFMIQVLSTPSGTVARPETLRGDIIGRNAVDFTQIWRDKHYIPAGTRITAYVHGSSELDREKVEGAQDQVSFTEFETTADVTIYRTKGHGRDRPRVLCDGIGRSIGQHEYIHLNLVPGKHSCRIENQAPEEIVVERGAEYYFHLQHSGSGWGLKQVTVGEGEDSIETADPAQKE